MRLLFLLILLFSAGCIEVNEVGDNPYKAMGIDDQFFPQVAEFEKLWGHQLTNTSIFFVDTFGEDDMVTLAECLPGLMPKLIRVNKVWWIANPNKFKRELLIFHELGHCALGRDHLEDMENGDPKSIMYPYLTPMFEPYPFNRDKYLKELFSAGSQGAPALWDCHEEDL